MFDVNKTCPVGTLFDVEFLDTEIRLDQNDRDELQKVFKRKLYFYDIRENLDTADEDGYWCQICDFVWVNHWSTIITLKPIDVPREIKEDDWWYDDNLSLAEFVALF